MKAASRSKSDAFRASLQRAARLPRPWNRIISVFVYSQWSDRGSAAVMVKKMLCATSRILFEAFV